MRRGLLLELPPPLPCGPNPGRCGATFWWHCGVQGIAQLGHRPTGPWPGHNLHMYMSLHAEGIDLERNLLY